MTVLFYGILIIGGIKTPEWSMHAVKGWWPHWAYDWFGMMPWDVEKLAGWTALFTFLALFIFAFWRLTKTEWFIDWLER